MGRCIFVRISCLEDCWNPLKENVIGSPCGIVVSNDSEGANCFFFFCIDSPCSVFLFQWLWWKKFWSTPQFSLQLNSPWQFVRKPQISSQIQHGNHKKTPPQLNYKFPQGLWLNKAQKKELYLWEIHNLLGPEIPFTCTLLWFTHFLTINVEKFLCKVLA